MENKIVPQSSGIPRQDWSRVATQRPARIVSGCGFLEVARGMHQGILGEVIAPSPHCVSGYATAVKKALLNVS